jgi:hypothetical protein
MKIRLLGFICASSFCLLLSPARSLPIDVAGGAIPSLTQEIAHRVTVRGHHVRRHKIHKRTVLRRRYVRGRIVYVRAPVVESYDYQEPSYRVYRRRSIGIRTYEDRRRSEYRTYGRQRDRDSGSINIRINREDSQKRQQPSAPATTQLGNGSSNPAGAPSQRAAPQLRNEPTSAPQTQQRAPVSGGAKVAPVQKPTPTALPSASSKEGQPSAR